MVMPLCLCALSTIHYNGYRTHTRLCYYYTNYINRCYDTFIRLCEARRGLLYSLQCNYITKYYLPLNRLLRGYRGIWCFNSVISLVQPFFYSLDKLYYQYHQKPLELIMGTCRGKIVSYSQNRYYIFDILNLEIGNQIIAISILQCSICTLDLLVSSFNLKALLYQFQKLSISELLILKPPNQTYSFELKVLKRST